MRIKSIARFLLVLLLFSVTALVGIVTCWSYIEATHEVEELFDAELAQMARVLQSLLAANLAAEDQSLFYRQAPILLDDDDEATPRGHKYEKKLTFQVWDKEGNPILGDGGKNITLGFSQTIGYGNEQQDSNNWRTFNLFDADKQLWIKVGQSHDVRGELTEEIVISTVLPFIILLPLLLIVIGLVIKQSLLPLVKISHQVQSRDPNHLQALDKQDVPTEVISLVDAINSLMTKVTQALTRERELTANAAHELRTPLAAIRIHTQNLQERMPGDSTKNMRALSSIISGVDRMSHVVEQLLTLTQLEFHRQPELKPMMLEPIVQQVIADILPLAEDKQQELVVTIEKTEAILGNASNLETLCRNLLDNAIRYAPTGGKIRISLRQHNKAVQLTVVDNGPGIPDSEKNRVLERFYRLQHQEIQGSGLGLAIVKAIVDQHDGEILIVDSPDVKTGACINIVFYSLTPTDLKDSPS